MKNISVLASGNGTNLQAILDAIESGRIRGARLVLVISDNKEAFALERAKKHGIPAIHIDPKNYASREDFDREAVARLREAGTDLVVLAGFMRVVTPYFVRSFPRRIMNIHPALLPCFPGAHAVEDALEYGVKVAGCTVHFVDEGVDTGPIILQEALPVREDDTPETLRERIHVLEHRLYPRAISLWLQNKITILGRRCLIDE
jgi:phosphoribosylglycinamide formyltransferase-1